MRELNQKQKAFVRGITKELKSATVAYKDAGYDAKNDNVAAAAASRLLKTVKVRKSIEEHESEMDVYGSDGLETALTLMSDPKTPANVRKDIAFKFMALAGLQEVQKVETKNETVIEGLTDAKSRRELLQGALDDLNVKKT